MHPSPQQQIPLLDPDLRPAKPGNPLFCHEDFLSKLGENRNNPVGKRASLLLHRLWVDERRQHYKGTLGANRGWRRTRLGGNSGNHFYAWWAPKGAAPIKGHPQFETAAEGAIFLRDIRHHDDHSPLHPQSLADHYLAVGIRELRQQDYVPEPWTAVQSRFAAARQPVRVVKGYPGSGKSTALWHAADSAAAEAVLYVTFSTELAALARDHFDKFSPATKRFQVVTVGQLLAAVAGREAPAEPVHEARRRFVKEAAGLSPRLLGPWLNSRGALYDEMHAHLIGAALPFAVARFPACGEPRLPDRAYRDLRERYIGRPAAEAVLEVASTMRKRNGGGFEARFFPELCVAWDAVRVLQKSSSGRVPVFDCLAVDEVQDLTPMEALALIELARGDGRRRVQVLAAGDEAQTVRPTDFEWGWFHDLAHHRIGSPAEFKLAANLRSPRRIAELVSRVWDLYLHIGKQERPGGFIASEIDEDASDQIVYCTAAPGAELNELLAGLADRGGLALISLDEEPPDYVPAAVRQRVLSVFEAKGLDFQAVCVLDAGKHLERIIRTTDHMRRDADIEDLSKRLAIDQLRVALSRPTERLYWLDVNPTHRVLEASRRFLEGREPGSVFPVVPALVLKTLEEELLLVDERVRLCENDARQVLAVKPALAWSRAQQAVALAAGAEEPVRVSAHLTAAEVAFRLAFRKLSLGAEMGRPDLYGEAVRHAREAGRKGLANILERIGDLERSSAARRPFEAAVAAAAICDARDEFASWLELEVAPKAGEWVALLEEGAKDPSRAAAMLHLLPPLYEVLRLPDAAARAARLRERGIATLMQSGAYEPAARFLESQPDADPRLLAACYEGAGRHADAAQCYLRAGDLKKALQSYRSVPDFEKALELVAGMKDHPAAASLEWVRRMQALVAERPAEFGKVILPAEKKLLEEILQAALGVSRRKPAARKAPTGRKPGRPRKNPPPAAR